MDMKYSLCLLMLLHRSEVACDRVFNIHDEVSSCSGWLATIIFNFCNNTYKIVKRDTSLLLEKIAPENLQRDLTRRRLLAEGRWTRIKRQVANECCLRPCTVADIISYCPEDSKLLVENPGMFD